MIEKASEYFHWKHLKITSIWLQYECLDRMGLYPFATAALGAKVIKNLFELYCDHNARECNRKGYCQHGESHCPLRNIFYGNSQSSELLPQPFVFRVFEPSSTYRAGDRIALYLHLLQDAGRNVNGQRNVRMFLEAAKHLEETGVGISVYDEPAPVRLLFANVSKSNLLSRSIEREIWEIENTEPEDYVEKLKDPRERNIRGNVYNTKDGWIERDIIGTSLFGGISSMYEDASPQAMTLEFVTHMHLERDGEFLQDPTFVDFIEFVVKRLNHLFDLVPLSASQKIDEAKYIVLARKVQNINDFRIYSHECYGSSLTGIYGQMMVIGDIMPFFPLLEAAFVMNIGDNCEMGMGHHRLKSIFPDTFGYHFLHY